MITKIAITGKIGAGKDAVAKILIANHGFENFKNAGALKDMTRAYIRHRRPSLSDEVIERFIEGDLKESPNGLFNGKPCRQFMQLLGTEFGRELIHPDLWVDATRDHGYPEKAVCTDVRFDNEAIALSSAGFKIWRKEGRQDKDRSSEIHQHESEAGIPDYLVDDVIPYFPDESDLRAYVERLLYRPNFIAHTLGTT